MSYRIVRSQAGVNLGAPKAPQRHMTLAEAHRWVNSQGPAYNWVYHVLTDKEIKHFSKKWKTSLH